MVTLFMVPWLSAGTRSGAATANARNTVSTIRCEVSTLPPATAAPFAAFTTEPGGAITVTGPKHPSLVGADPILIVLDREAARQKNPKGFGFRLCLGHMRNPEAAISMLKWAIQLSMASNGPQMSTIVKESGHRQTIQGTIELIGEGTAHLLEFAPV